MLFSPILHEVSSHCCGTSRGAGAPIGCTLCAAYTPNIFMAEPPREKAAQATDGTSGTTSDSASSGTVSPDITGDAAQLRNVNVAALEIAVSGAIPARCPFSGMPLTGMSLSRRSGDCADELLTIVAMLSVQVLA